MYVTCVFYFTTVFIGPRARSPLHTGRESTHTPTRVRGRLFSASHCNINSNVMKLHSEIMFKLPQNNIND